ncbi:hypothetical protein RZS08_35465, partial [Arthrospira platensis SPKY1]|nr:hypothetical protein [Arthrospira platensis SPKY1]
VLFWGILGALFFRGVMIGLGVALIRQFDWITYVFAAFLLYSALKIAPDLDAEQVQCIATSLQQHRMDGVIATNTTLSRDAVAGLPHADEAGGLSGAPVLEASNAVIRQLRAALGPNYPIIGVGGIMSGADALSKLQAGADVVQLYSGLVYKGPTLVSEVAHALQMQSCL